MAGENVRWNSTNKKDESLIQWAEREGITLIPVCPEDSLFGTPRSPIRLEKIEDKIVAHFKGSNVFEDLSRECDKISDNFKDVVGFIGIARSPTCGISVGVKNLGKTTKGFLHKSLRVPTTEVNQLRNENNRKAFVERIKKFKKAL